MANVQARAEELFQHGFEFRFVAGTESFARHRRQRLIGNVFREVFNAGQPTLELLPLPQRLIERIPVMESLPSGAFQIPVGSLKSEAMIDGPHHETGPRRAGLGNSRPKENQLPVVRIRHPMVEYQQASEIAQVDSLGEQHVRQRIEQSNL